MPRSTNTTSRRKFIATGAGAAGLTLSGCLETEDGDTPADSSGSNGNQGNTGTVGTTRNKFEGETIVVQGPGGQWQDFIRDIVADPFEEETGATVKTSRSPNTSDSWAEIEATGGDPGYDVVLLAREQLLIAEGQDLLAEIPEEYENAHGVAENYQDVLPLGAITTANYLTLFTHEEHNAGGTDSWETLWHPGNEGHVVLIHPDNTAGVFLALIAAKMNGGGIDNLDPGFEKLAELCPDQILTTIVSSDDMFTYSDSEEVWAAPFWSGRATTSILDNDEPYEMTVPDEGAPLTLTGGAVPSGSDNKELAFEFIDFWGRPEISAEWANEYLVGPGHPDAVEHLTDEAKQVVPNVDMPNFEKLYVTDREYIGNNREEITERWEREVGSKC